MLLVIGLLIAFAIPLTSSYAKQPVILSQSYANALTLIKLKDLSSPYVQQLIRDRTITNQDNTLLQQAGEFYSAGSDAQATALIENAASGIIPLQYSFEVVIDNKRIYARGSKQEQSQLLIASRKILFGVTGKSGNPWGPILGEVRIWE